MEYITGRERKIIEWLLRTQHQFTTIRELADVLDVSSRTIHRELKNVERVLSGYSVNLKKQTGAGVQINGRQEQLHELETALREGKDHDLQQEERIVVLLHYLIKHHKPVKTAILTRLLNCAIGTLLHDLDTLEKSVEPYGLSVVRRRGIGIQLTGSEREKRRALAALLIEQMDASSLYSMVDEHFIYPGMVDDKVGGIVSRELLTRVERLIMDEVKDLPYTLADGAYLALVIHISLAIQRIMSGEKIGLEDSVKDELSQTVEFTVAQSLTQSLAEEFNVEIPIEEAGYIAIHLKGANRKDQLPVQSTDNTELTLLVQTLIQQVGQQVGVDFTGDRSLTEGLIAHLEPAIHRAGEGLQAFNPLTETIVEDYPILYRSIEQVLEELFQGMTFSRGELAFLVLHFASSLEIRKEEISVSALVVCSSGIGTSKMLASRLKKEFPEITTITLASLTDARTLPVDQYDVIISTIGLVDIDREFLLVNPLLPENDVDRVRRFLQKNMPLITSKKGYRKIEDPAVFKEPVVHSLEKIQQLTAIMIQLLKDFALIKMPGVSSQDELLTAADKYGAAHEAAEGSGTILTLLKSREALGGLGIPETNLALYHARAAEINRPLFVIFEVEEPMPVKSMDSNVSQMKRMILLLAPDGMGTEIYELLSMISASIIEEDAQLELYSNGSEQAIYRLLEQKCDQFIRQKMNSFLEGK
ncbi:BglG family transcription antiterminator [Jeotgalibacillus proteolyticus]|uniref:Uncharacterized protein n=1 Tax=Jeotgalibacillus proteolyticus TaxID=2082395 RepID=A0A2S5GCE0_9BACL|nr:PRD domain-containing protein [Jeotgalibacillus proteolyticus]PPA70585.1 hypothetical protein C4B60_07220 [Jeotgalibacillus proteolyticus]